MGTYTTSPVEQEVAPHVTSTSAESVGRHYLLCLLLVPLLGYLFPFIAESMSPLNNRSISQWGQILDYGYNLNNENADIVIFGDSSALYGIDTPLLSQRLGMKVMNIPGSSGSLQVTGDSMLRRYLAGNRPPRLIVFYFTPGNLDYMSMQSSFSYEGDEQILRHESLAGWIQLARRRPEDVFLFPFRFYMTPSKLTRFFDPGRLGKIEVKQGHTPITGAVVQTKNCSLPEKSFLQADTKSVQELVKNFSSAQTRTLVYLAPLPRCQHSSEIAAVHYPGIDAQPPAVLPSEGFERDEFYVHPLGSTTASVTDLLANRIQSLGLR
jgi:hypothetical protein